MTFSALPPWQASPTGTKWVFNPPPGWPAPPPEWQPPTGWQPDASWPAAPAGWEFWKPASQGRPDVGSFSVTANELRLTIDGRSYVFQPGQPIRIGRALGNEVVVGDPAISRQHAQLSWGNGEWVFENIGQAPTFLHGQPVTRVAVSQALNLVLGSAYGPALRIEVSSAPNDLQ